MKKTIVAAAMAALAWSGVALAGDDYKDESFQTTDETQSMDESFKTDDSGLGGSGMETQPETNVNVDVNTPAPVAATAPAPMDDKKNKESKSDMRGLTFLVGGGVEGYSGSLAPRLAPGPTWGVNAALKPTKVLGIELGYSGATNEVRNGEAIRGGADVVRNGGQAVATLGLGAAPVQPYVLGGIGASRYNIRGGAAGLRDDTVGNIPMGGGIRTHVGNFTADVRGSYNMLFDNGLGTPAGDNRFDFQNGNSGRWNGMLNVGTTF